MFSLEAGKKKGEKAGGPLLSPSIRSREKLKESEILNLNLTFQYMMTIYVSR